MADVMTSFYQNMKRLLNKKGQGLVELALILGFCVGIGFLVRDSGLLDAMTDSFNHGVSAFLTDVVGDGGSTPSGNGGAGQQQSNNQQQSNQQQEGEDQQQGGQQQGGQQQGGQQQGGQQQQDNNTNGISGINAGIGISGKNWREENPIDYYNKIDSEDRLSADRKALENLAKHFIGMKQFEVQALMRSAQTADMGYCDDSKMQGTEITLGHVIPNKDKNGTIKGMKFRTNQKGAALKAEYEDDIFCWMQSEENASYDPTYMYLVSDYVVSQDWADKSGGNQQNGIKLRLEYDYSGQFTDPSHAVVIGAHVIIDPRSQHNTLSEAGTSSDYNSMSSAGLDVQVRSDGNGGTDVTYHDTGRFFTADNINDNLYGSYNWYGEGDYRLVQQYIADKAKRIDNSNMQESEFNKGDIVYTTNTEGKITGYYIAFKDGSQKVSSSSVQDYDPNNNTKKLNIFVKFETQIFRYWHENDKTKFIEANQSFEPKYIKTRGTVLTKDNGDMYVYVGDRTSNQNNLPFEGINSDWLLIGNIRQTN